MSQTIVFGISSAALYALFASGLTLVFGVLDIVNLAHGAVYMWGAFVAWDLMVRHGLSLGIAISVAVVATGLLGVALEYLVFRQLRRRNAPGLMSLVAGLAAANLLVYASQSTFGAEVFRFPADALGGQIHVGSITSSAAEIFVVVAAVLLLGSMWWVIKRTRLGLAIRAIEEKRDIAALMGIPVDRIISLVFFGASAMAGLAGVAVGLTYASISPFMGETLELKAFTIIILGGMGSIGGTVVASVAVAALETLAVVVNLSAYQDLAVFVLVLVLLMVRPQGLFGRLQREA
jgi:branched-chain amino acid transport system permease protein